jgi:hypothetical protein
VQVEKEKDILKNEGNALKDKLNEADQTRITQVCLRGFSQAIVAQRRKRGAAVRAGPGRICTRVVGAQ